MKEWQRVNKKIKEANDLAEESGDPNAIILEHNVFSDFTPEQLQTLLGYKPDAEHIQQRDERTKRREEILANEEYHKNRRLSRLGEIDWPSSGYINDVVFQGYCGACWAISANTALTSRAALKTGLLVKLSAQQQLDCTADNEENKRRFGSTYNQDGCYGGFETGTFKFYQ